MLERNYQQKIIKKIEYMIPCLVIKSNEQSIQGFPDLLILGEETWAALEVKKSKNAHRQPNQEYWVDRLNDMAFARFIYPENEEEVLDELQRAFGNRRKARHPRS